MLKTEYYSRIFISAFVTAVLLFTGCEQVVTTSTGPTPSPINESTTSPLSTELPYRFDSTIVLSQAPKIGETAELTLTVDIIRLDEETHPREGLARSKAGIDFYWTNIHGSFSEAYSSVQIPVEEVLVDGELTWEGSYTDGLTLHGKIKLPREGIWSIRGHFIGEGWSYGTGDEVEVAVADGTAAIMGTEDFKNGPLAYLGNNSYAGGVFGPGVPTDTHPVSLGLDISKAPRPGEEVTLSCRIISLIDVPDVSIQWSFYKRTEQIPETELLTSEDLGWKTDVKKDTPVVFSTLIKFPTEGDWEVAAGARSGTKYLTGSGHRLKLSITPTRSFFGWEGIPQPGEPTNAPPGTTTTAQR
jgi:hypothetical protein